MRKLNLQRPLAVFDIEATGISPRADRIVELAIVRLMPDGSRDSHEFRINPEMPIPPEATEIHGIHDADVADCPTFSRIASQVSDILKDCDLCGYNVLRFDIPMLTEEFLRADKSFDMDGRKVIDPQRIYHRREPRDLTAALAFFCNEMHLDAHGAKADVDVTIRVLEGQLEKYQDLPIDIAELDEYCNPREPGWVDKTGKLKWNKDEVVINFGKKKGASLRELINKDTGFINWMLKSDFPKDTRDIITAAMNGNWPNKD